MLLAQRIASQREQWVTVGDLEEAHHELVTRSRDDEEIRWAWLRPRRHTIWAKCWAEELEPALLLARHRSLPASACMMLAPEATEACDVVLEHSADKHERLEITMAYASAGGLDGGAQEALRTEMLQQEGWVCDSTPLQRNAKTRRVEYAEEMIAKPVEQTFENWRRGLERALENKKPTVGRPLYGSGSTLVVYGYGLSGDFEMRWKEQRSIDSVLNAVPRDSFRNNFERTIVMGWHAGWIREFRPAKVTQPPP